MNEISTYDFNGQGVRLIEKEDNPWFVAGDVAKILEYRDAANMVRLLDDDEKGTHSVSTLGGRQTLTIISESGLYSCILRSQRQEAKAFRKWVTSEVLPSIRKTGSYSQQHLDEKKELALLRNYHEADRRYWREKARRIHGRKPVSETELINMIYLFELGYGTAAIAEQVERSRSTVRRCIRSYEIYRTHRTQKGGVV